MIIKINKLNGMVTYANYFTNNVRNWESIYRFDWAKVLAIRLVIVHIRKE